MKPITIFITLFFHCIMLSGQQVNPQKVLERLIQARGEFRDDYPEIKILDRTKSIAAYSTTSNTIILERKAMEVLHKLGEYAEPALAFLVSHELTHYFQNRVWNNMDRDMSFFTSKDRLDIIKPLEIEADKYGAFLCYLAGYPYAEVAPLAIETLYQAYHLNQNNPPGYPPPSERKAMTLTVCNEVDNYKILFESAQALAHFGAYEWSRSIYKYLLRFLDFQEIYNNLASDKLKWVLALDESSLLYPIVYQKALSLRSSLNVSRDLLLDESIQYLEVGIRKDPTNHDLFINLASAYLLKESFELFYQLSDQLKLVNLSRHNRHRLNILEGIHAIQLKDTSHAVNLFKDVRAQTSSSLLQELCAKNLKVVEGSVSRESIGHQMSFHYPRVTDHHSESNSFWIDQSDPLFAKKATLRHLKEGVEIIFSDGQNEISIFKVNHDSANFPSTDNCYSHVHAQESIKFYVKGI